MEPTYFNDIITDQKIKIFQYLSINERHKIRLVCRDWRNIVNEGFGLKIRVRNNTSDLVKTCESAIEVELCSMTIPFPNGGIVFSNRLQVLKFTNIVVTYNVVNFLRECERIKSLSFLNVVIDIPMNDPWSSPEEREILLLGNVESLDIQCFTFTDSIMELLVFLKDRVEFGALKEISVTARNPPVLPLHMLFTEGSQEDNHVLLKLVANNLRSIRKFVVGRPTASTVFKFHQYGIFGEDNPIQLSELVINSYFREEWAAFFHNQDHLEVLDVGSVNVNRWVEIHQGIMRSATTLTHFNMFGSTFGNEWDCTVFQNCTLLQSLTLEIRNSPKVNLAHLPIQLSHLDLWGPIILPEILSILGLVNLQFIKISNLIISGALDEPEDDKIDLETFKALLQLPDLKTLIFASCTRFSLDWSRITHWCAANSATGLSYEKHYFHNRIHGTSTPDGITVTLSPNFERDSSRWNNEEDITTENSRSRSTTVSTVTVDMSTMSI